MTERAASKPSSLAPLGSDSARVQEAIGTDYELGELLGSGGFAEVYLAWDRRLKREVAVKSLRSELAASPAAVDRFRREAEAIAKLRHPNIITVYAVGENAAWFTMPRIRGETLAQALERGERWSFAEVVRILRETAGALAEAHRNGIVHRDVKPENIMLDGPQRRVVVTDFGIAKSMDQTLGSGLTGTGILIGTPYYMSPEQAAGDKHIDHLSDQYSLGIVGFRMLTGRLPFESESMRELIMQQVANTVTPVRELRPDVPPALARVIERAVQKSPELRYRSMDELAEALGAIAAEVAGEFKTGRRAPNMADRWAAARIEIGARPWRRMVIAAAAAMVFGIAYGRVEWGLVRRLIGERDESLYAVRAYLAGRGAPRDLAFNRTHAVNEAPLEVLLKAVGRDSMERLAHAGVPLVFWSVLGNWPDDRESWSAAVGPQQQVLGFTHWLADSTKRPEISADSARALAEAELRRAGYDPASLRLLRRSESQRPNRTERMFTWDVPSHRAVHGNDTVRTEVTVSVAGDEPRGLSRMASSVRPDPPGLTRTTQRLVFAIALVLVFLTVGYAAFIAWKRSSSDTLQLRSALTVAAVFPVSFFLGFTVPRMVRLFAEDAVGQRALASSLNALNQDVPMLGFSALITAVGFIAAESIFNEKRPDTLFGVMEWSRGRFIIPEIIPAALNGYMWGFLILAGAFVLLGLAQLFGSPLHLTPFVRFPFNSFLPQTGILYMAGPAFLLAVFPAVFLALAMHRGASPWLAIVAFGLLAGFFRINSSNENDVRTAVEALAFATVAWLCWRRGALTAVVATLVAFAFPLAVDFFWAGGPFVSAGVLCIVGLCLPAALAVAAFRRSPRGPDVATPPRGVTL